MTDEQMTAFRAEMAQAVQQAVREGVGAVATAMRAVSTERPPPPGRATKVHNPLAIIGVCVSLFIPLGGWVMSVQSRVSVLEVQQTSLQTAAVEISALKQELTDFRQDFRDWKRENVMRKDAPPRLEGKE
jgi:hypothetical protein